MPSSRGPVGRVRRSHPFLRRTLTRRPGSSSPGAGAAGAGLGGGSCSGSGWCPAISAITSRPGCWVREAEKRRLRREEWGSRNRAPKHRVTRPERKSRKRNFCGSRSPHGEAGTKPGTFLMSITERLAARACQLHPPPSPGVLRVLKVGELKLSGCGVQAGQRTPRPPLWDQPEVQGVWSKSSHAGAGARRPRRGPGEGGYSAGARARRAPQPALRLVHGARALPRLLAPEPSHAVRDALTEGA